MVKPKKKVYHPRIRIVPPFTIAATSFLLRRQTRCLARLGVSLDKLDVSPLEGHTRE